MKQCPVCKESYTDDQLQYCLADGTLLTASSDDFTTVVRPGDDFHADPTIAVGAGTESFSRSPTAGPDVEAPQMRDTAAKPAASKIGHRVIWLLAAVFGAAVVLLILIFAGGLGLYIFNGTRDAANTSPSPQRPTPRVATPTPARSGDDDAELKRQLANLQKLLDEKTEPKVNTNDPVSDEDETTTARVNSPSDGFLALRTQPSSDTGARILQIPNGAEVTIGGCHSSTRVAGKVGRWCRASYGGHVGWVFDAFLLF